MKNWLWNRIANWLNRERRDRRHAAERPPSDYDRLCYEIRPGDVLLLEGRARVSEVIKYVTLSSWTHAALYIGRLHDVQDPATRERIRALHDPAPDEQLIVEAQLGLGTIVRPLAVYRRDHLRICRPNRLAPRDAQRVIDYAVARLGHDYDLRHILDLLRFMLPWSALPRRWRSCLFEKRAGTSTRTICSTLIARAFASVRYPILPVLRHDEAGRVQLYRRSSRLITPRDFDYSPYFDLIKYPVFDFDELALYRRLPWGEDGLRADAARRLASDPLLRDAGSAGGDDQRGAPSASEIGDAIDNGGAIGNDNGNDNDNGIDAEIDGDAAAGDTAPGAERDAQRSAAGGAEIDHNLLALSCALPNGLPTESAESPRDDRWPA